MSTTTTSANMGLVIPTVGQETGPAWATDINNCLTTIDSHNHASGNGVQITPDGLNISSDLSYNANNLTLVRSVRFNQSSSLSLSAFDLAAIYVKQGSTTYDLWYVNSAGTQVQITNGASVSGSTGNITGLPSGSAGLNYSSGVFTFTAAAGTPAVVSGGSYTINGSSFSSPTYTVAAPSLSTSATGTMPVPPTGSAKIVQMDTSGNMTANVVPDNSSVQLSSNTLSIKPLGVTNAMLAALNYAISSSCGNNFNVTGTTFTSVTNLSVTITTVGRPIFIGIINDASTNNGFFSCFDTSPAASYIQILNGTTAISQQSVQAYSTGTVSNSVPVSSFSHIDIQSSGTYTYTVKIASSTSSGRATISYAKLIAYEL